MPIGSFGVVDYVNTTASSVTNVVAVGDVGGSGVVGHPILPTKKFLITETTLFNIITESGSYIITE